MDPVHVHLALSRLPLYGTLIGAGLLVAALWRHSRELCAAALVILGVSAAATVPVFFTGESTEERVESLAGISESVIDRHEQVALTTLLATLALGGTAAVTLLFVRRVGPTRWLVAGPLLLSLIVLGLMVYTSFLGGRIRHTEIGGSGSPSASIGLPENDD
jgi:hypothetical protein